MSRLPSEVKITDFTRTTQRNGGIIAAVSPPDTNPGIHVLALSKCNIRSIFRQFKRIAVIVWSGPADRTVLFDKVEFFYMVGNLVVGPLRRDHNYTTLIFGKCSEARVKALRTNATI